jgi:hypothetical protein
MKTACPRCMGQGFITPCKLRFDDALFGTVQTATIVEELPDEECLLCNGTGVAEPLIRPPPVSPEQ